jgi:hypothetical protein
MAEKFELAPVNQAVEENGSKLNLVELSGLQGKTFSREQCCPGSQSF